MKNKVLSLFIVLVTRSGISVHAENRTEKINVNGKCEMCEKRIEMAALSVDGVSKADWSKDTKILEVTFDETKTTSDKIEVAIAKVGHDTPHHKA